MSLYCDCARIEIISKYFISKGLFLITAAFGWHARASSHSWSILAAAQAKRSSAPFSREHTFLPNVAFVPCQGRWANCHFWLPTTKRQRLSTFLSPLSQNEPHTLKDPDYYWLFFPHRLYNIEYFLSASVSPQGRFRHLQQCVTPLKASGGSLKCPCSSVWGLSTSILSVSPLFLAFIVSFF